jgi:hypothetical protein
MSLVTRADNSIIRSPDLDSWPDGRLSAASLMVGHCGSQDKAGNSHYGRDAYRGSEPLRRQSVFARLDLSVLVHDTALFPKYTLE